MGLYAMTGGATGIGEAIKHRLRQDGHKVVVVDIKEADIIADLASAEGRAAGRLLIDQAYSYSKDHDLDLVASLALRHTDEFRLLRSRGFWVCPKFLQPQPYRLVIRCHDEEASPSRLAYDLRNWFVTMADYDAV